jgi:V/A-type H+-transporting ATPase subunit C
VLGTISFGRYPYLSARMRAMKSKLLSKHDYEKMVKMDLYTLAKFLEERAYQLPDSVGEDKMQVANAVEMTVNKDLENTISKLLFITAGEVRKVMVGYAIRFDIENLKTILRGKIANEPIEKVEQLCICAGIIDREKLRELYKIERCEEIIKNAGIFRLDKEMHDAIEVYEKEHKLYALENVLDKKYHKFLVVLAKKVQRGGALLKKFVRTRIDILNLRTIYRLKRDGFKKEDILKYITPFGYKLKLKDLEYLASAETLEELHQRVDDTHYGGIVGDIDISDSFAELELALEKYFLRFASTMMHTNPISITPLIAYAIMKETEARNIKMIARGKQYGFDESFIMENLVVI